MLGIIGNAVGLWNVPRWHMRIRSRLRDLTFSPPLTMSTIGVLQVRQKATMPSSTFL